MCQLTNKLAAKIAPHIYCDLRDLGVVFDKSILSRGSVLAGADRASTSKSCYGTQNEEENTQNNVIEGDIIRDMTVDIDEIIPRKG